MMQSTDLWYRYDVALVSSLNWSGFRAVHLKGQVRSGPIVVRDVSGKNSSQMVFAEYDDVVQTLSPYTAVESFRIRILPGTMRRREDFFDAHVLDPPSEPVPIYLVSIPEQILRRRVPGKCFHDLLCCPCRGRVFRHSAMKDAAAIAQSSLFFNAREPIRHAANTTMATTAGLMPLNRPLTKVMSPKARYT